MSLDQLPPGVPLSAIPIEKNPDGSPPNFIDPPSLYSTVLATGVTFAALATICVALKSCSSLSTSKERKYKDRLDDFFSVLALLIAYAYTGIVISFRDTHLHMWDIPLSALTTAYVKKTTVIGILYGVCAWAGKMALLILLHRIFNPKVTFLKFVYLGMALVSVAHLSSIPLYAALCHPVKGQHWDVEMLNGRCAHPTALHTIIIGAIGTALDIYIWVLPLPMIFRLHLEMKRRIGLAIVFMGGLLAIIASSVANYFRVLMYRGEDMSWNVARTYICVIAETYVIIIVGCAPAIAALWRKRSAVISGSAFFTSFRSLLGSRSYESQVDSESKSKTTTPSKRTNSSESRSTYQIPLTHNLEESPRSAHGILKVTEIDAQSKSGW